MLNTYFFLSSHQDIQKLLSEANRMLDVHLDSMDFLDKGLHLDERNARLKQDSNMEGRPPQAASENTPDGSRLSRKEQQAIEVQNKLKILGQYGSPGCPPGFLSPASLRTHKPYQTPIRKPFISYKNEQKEN